MHIYYLEIYNTRIEVNVCVQTSTLCLSTFGKMRS